MPDITGHQGTAIRTDTVLTIRMAKVLNTATPDAGVVWSKRNSGVYINCQAALEDGLMVSYKTKRTFTM